MTWHNFFNDIYKAKNQKQVIALIRQAINKTLADRSRVTDTHGRQATYNLLVMTLKNLKRYHIPRLHVKFVVLATGVARLRAPIVPQPSQLRQFDELWGKLETIKLKCPIAKIEVFSNSAADEYQCYSEAESLLEKFKPLCDPLNPQLTEEDIAAFWEDD